MFTYYARTWHQKYYCYLFTATAKRRPTWCSSVSHAHKIETLNITVYSTHTCFEACHPTCKIYNDPKHRITNKKLISRPYAKWFFIPCCWSVKQSSNDNNWFMHSKCEVFWLFRLVCSSLFAKHRDKKLKRNKEFSLNELSDCSFKVSFSLPNISNNKRHCEYM